MCWVVIRIVFIFLSTGKDSSDMFSKWIVVVMPAKYKVPILIKFRLPPPYPRVTAPAGLCRYRKMKTTCNRNQHLPDGVSHRFANCTDCVGSSR
ncbi:hypothetical protein CDAR_85681 [Caerostris darwini]|uniref:Secreted protein n=1 Tax=Caerostris darwini TaxID=1538125 RepID=A0AAV4QG39_9ARAC|nr:hypothetical protein CDAR_85681 [Caerostris darwini]